MKRNKNVQFWTICVYLFFNGYTLTCSLPVSVASMPMETKSLDQNSTLWN